MKKVKSFRLTDDVANLISNAAKRAGMSEGEIVSEAVIAQVLSVVEARLKRRAAILSPDAAGGLADLRKLAKDALRKKPLH